MNNADAQWGVGRLATPPLPRFSVPPLRRNGGFSTAPKSQKKGYKGVLTAPQNNRQIPSPARPRVPRADNSEIDGRLRRNPQL